MKKVYLAGAINGCSDAECKSWRNSARLAFAAEGVQVLDPMVRDERGREDKAWVEIVEGDKADILRCDAVLLNAARPSWGTGMEFLFAFMHDVPVVVLLPPDASISPWIRYHAARIRFTPGEAVKAVLEILRNG